MLGWRESFLTIEIIYYHPKKEGSEEVQGRERLTDGGRKKITGSRAPVSGLASDKSLRQILLHQWGEIQ